MAVQGGQGKIFGIGLSKTGTSSLAQALQRLGYKTKDCMGALRYVPGDLASIDMDTVLAHDALTDTPIPSFYRELDTRFPGSKFILTVRERAGWVQSCRKQFNERSAAAQNDAHRRLFEDLYGTNVFDESGFTAGYDRFVAGVLEYFRDRPQDLLVMNVTAGDGWDKLCPFLGRPVPDMPFPKANVTRIRWIDMEDLVALAEAAGRELIKRYRGDVEPVARGPALSLAAAAALDRAWRAALGRDGTDAAMRAAHRVLAAGLARLAADIPVVSPMDEPPPHEERRQWNHLWLVDPLDGRGAYAAGRPDFSVNIALVEDGRPIYGIVHAPARGTTYFGRILRGAFRRVTGGVAERLTGRAIDGNAMPAAPADDGSSRSLAMCRAIDATEPAPLAFGPAPEWRCAAGNALLALAEVRVNDAGTGVEPIYNSAELAVAGLRLDSWEPA